MTSSSGWQTVWITGASSGIGAELSARLAGQVDHVAVSARSAETLEAIAKQFPSCSAFPVDVTDAEACATAIQAIRRTCGEIDLAIFCAGVWKLMDVTDMGQDGIATGMNVNFMGVINCISAVLPGMIVRRRGHIAIVASVAGYRGLPRAVAYGPTKAALINLAETLRCELMPLGITVSIINPGFVDTPMTQDNPFPMPGLIQPNEAAESIVEGLGKGRYEITFPRPFAWGMKLLKLMPNAVYFWIVRTFVMPSARR